jgi:hypothetical protein
MKYLTLANVSKRESGELLPKGELAEVTYLISMVVDVEGGDGEGCQQEEDKHEVLKELEVD